MGAWTFVMATPAFGLIVQSIRNPAQEIIQSHLCTCGRPDVCASGLCPGELWELCVSNSPFRGSLVRLNKPDRPDGDALAEPPPPPPLPSPPLLLGSSGHLPPLFFQFQTQQIISHRLPASLDTSGDGVRESSCAREAAERSPALRPHTARCRGEPGPAAAGGGHTAGSERRSGFELSTG